MDGRSMGWFGNKKTDQSQDKQIQQIWKWIETLNKNQQVLIKNNTVFIENEKNQRQLNQQFSNTINALVEKDKQHDATDAEIQAVLKGIRDRVKAVEQTQTEG